ncbi:hypothetical protein N7342_12865, partial [Chromobacterium haemolyticum]
LGHCFLTAHRIQADQATFHVHAANSAGMAVISLLLSATFSLAQSQSKLGGEGADHVHRAVLAPSGAAQAFAVDGDLLERAQQPLRSATEGVFELLWVQQAKYAVDRIVRGYAVLQRQKTPQPSFLGFRPLDDFHETLRAGEDGANDNDQNFWQGMGDIASRSRFWHIGQMFH